MKSIKPQKTKYGVDRCWDKTGDNKLCITPTYYASLEYRMTSKAELYLISMSVLLF